MAQKTVPVTFNLPQETLEAFRKKMELQPVMSKNTGRLATESELIEGLMEFFIRGDIVSI